MWHSGAVVSTVASPQEGPEFNFTIRPGAVCVGLAQNKTFQFSLLLENLVTLQVFEPLGVDYVSLSRHPLSTHSLTSV